MARRKYDVKLFENGICIDHANVTRKVAEKIQALITETLSKRKQRPRVPDGDVEPAISSRRFGRK